MKKYIIIFLSTFISIASFSQKYYWYKGNKIPLTEKRDKKFILTKSSNQMKTQRVLNQRGATYINFNDFIYAGTDNSQISKSVSNPFSDCKWSIVSGINTAITNITNVIYEAPFYLSNGYEMGISNLFYVKIKNIIDLEKMKDLASQHHVEIIGANIFMPMWYTLACTKNSTGNALEMANVFYESNYFEASEPDFMVDKILCTNDQYFKSQWNLKNSGQNGGTSGVDINLCNAHTITKGSSNVIVAVIDHGIELDHPDFNNIHSLSYDSETNTSPSIVRGDHGTACAGIIGANTNNNLGVAGIAPDVKLMSISNKLRVVPNAPQTLANGFNFAVNNGAWVISNSWGHNSLKSTMIDDAIKNALTKGRKGKGCVVVFASGNNDSEVIYPANSNNDLIVVGAMSPCGQRKTPSSCDRQNWGSNYGPTLDLVAPGVLIPTTDRKGTAGYGPSDYYLKFNGTSSACPHVAGVAALILSKNPDLTQKEVVNIIESTTRKVGSYNYSTISGRVNGTWNNEMGYGLLDAYAALIKASGSECQTTDFSKKNITGFTTVSCENITASNVKVSKGGTLILNGKKSIRIGSSFEVESGGSIELNNK